MLNLDNKEIDKKVQEQVRRMSGLRSYPSSASARTELKKALARSGSLRHAEAVVDRILDTFMFCPSPMEVSQAVESVPAESFRASDCEICHGSGWYHQEMENSTHGCMVCCSCSAGDSKRDTLRASGARVMGGRG